MASLTPYHGCVLHYGVEVFIYVVGKPATSSSMFNYNLKATRANDGIYLPPLHNEILSLFATQEEDNPW